MSKKKNMVLPINIPQYVIMNVYFTVCDRSGLLSLSLSVFRPTRTTPPTRGARICVKRARGSERAMQFTSEYPRTRERERQCERETAPMMSLQRTFSPSREAERCLETAASTGSSRAHQLRKRGT